MTGNGAKANYEVFRECVSQSLIQRSSEKPSTVSGRRRNKATQKEAPIEESNSPEELAEFIDYIADEMFTGMPTEFQDLTYSALQSNSALAEKYADPLPQATLDMLVIAVPLSVPESLSVYGIVPDISDFPSFLNPIATEYIATVSAAPPVWASTRTTACEICGRDWVPLTYHHLIPRAVHAKALKRKWHEEWELNKVAWLCRACHSFVHRMASNEELAKEWYTVERILEREDVQRWAQWVERIRWKAR